MIPGQLALEILLYGHVLSFLAAFIMALLLLHRGWSIPGAVAASCLGTGAGAVLFTVLMFHISSSVSGDAAVMLVLFPIWLFFALTGVISTIVLGLYRAGIIRPRRRPWFPSPPSIEDLPAPWGKAMVDKIVSGLGGHEQLIQKDLAETWRMAEFDKNTGSGVDSKSVLSESEPDATPCPEQSTTKSGS